MSPLALHAGLLMGSSHPLSGNVLGATLASKRESMGDSPPDALIVFASSRFGHKALLSAHGRECNPKLMVGSPSAGEFTGQRRGEGTACVLALRSDELQLAAGVGRGVSRDRTKAASAAVAAFRGPGLGFEPESVSQSLGGRPVRRR